MMVKLMLLFTLKLFTHEQVSVLANSIAISNSWLQYLFLLACRRLVYRHIWFGSTPAACFAALTKVVTQVNVTGLRALAGNQMTDSLSFAFSDVLWKCFVKGHLVVFMRNTQKM